MREHLPKLLLLIFLVNLIWQLSFVSWQLAVSFALWIAWDNWTFNDDFQRGLDVIKKELYGDMTPKTMLDMWKERSMKK